MDDDQTNQEGNTRRPTRSALILLVALTLSDCGGESTDTDSPKAAATGFLAGIEAGEFAEACNFIAGVEADLAQRCPEALQEVKFEVKDFEVGDVFINGDRAVVTVISKGGMCAGGECVTNDDSSAGQPNVDAPEFDDAYEAAGSENSPAIQLMRVNNAWGVDLDG